jgi:hypothetical protein
MNQDLIKEILETIKKLKKEILDKEKLLNNLLEQYQELTDEEE